MNEGTKRVALHNQELGAYWAAKARGYATPDAWAMGNEAAALYAVACQEHARRSYAIARAILTDDPAWNYEYMLGN